MSSKEFALINTINKKSLEKACFRASAKSKKICTLSSYILHFTKISGIGRGGKTLFIWSKPLSEEEARLVEMGFKIEDICEAQKAQILAQSSQHERILKEEVSLTQGHLNKALSSDEASLSSGVFAKKSKETSKEAKAQNLAQDLKQKEVVKAQKLTQENLALSPFAKASFKKQNEAVQKASIIRQWQRAKKSLSVKEFITLINAKESYELSLSENKLFAWQRAFKEGGLDALIDKRTSTKQNKITQLGLEELFESVLLAQKGRLNISNIHRIMNYEMASRGELELGAFLAKKDEFVSYENVLSMSKKYLKKHKLVKNLLLYGEDGAISRHLPALGRANWAVRSVNEIVEIDASPLDAICRIDEMAVKLGIDKELLQEWQKRYTLISLIDTYSGVVSFHLSFAEDSVGIARAIAKYISTYGKPKCIHSDNGKAFLSKHTKALLERAQIIYKAMPAYSGWAKPYVENKFKALQNSLTANLIGYIGANVSQREAIEFFFSKKERRLKKGAKTNQKRLQNLEYMSECIDTYSQYFMNNSFLDRLGKSPKEAYEECADTIEMIDSLSLSLYLGGYCTNCDNCATNQMLIQKNGDVYICHRSQALKSLKSGNVFEQSYDELKARAIYNIQALENSLTLSKDCLECEYFYRCKASCPIERNDTKLGKSYTCSLQKAIFKNNASVYPSNKELSLREVDTFIRQNQILKHKEARLPKIDVENDMNERRNSLENLVKNDEILSQIFDKSNFLIAINDEVHSLCTLLDELGSVFVLSEKDRVRVLIKKAVFDINAKDRTGTFLHLMLLAGEPHRYGDDQRLKMKHLQTRCVFYEALLEEALDLGEYLALDLSEFLKAHQRHFKDDFTNALYFATEKMRLYHYEKQAKNAFYHIQAVNLPFARFGFRYLQGEKE